MNSFTSAIRRHSRGAALVLLPFLSLICGIHPARANGVNMGVGNGQIVYGTISSTANDEYTFPMPSGTYQFIVSIWESGGHSTTSNAEFRFINPNNTASGLYGDGNYDSDVDAPTSGVAGTWTVQVNNYQSSMTAAAYGLQINWWPGTISQPSGQAGGTMRNGETYSGTTNLGEADFYTFQGIGGQNYTLTLTKTSGGAGYCPLAKLVFPDGTNNGSYATCTTTSVGRAAHTGTNYIFVANTYFGNGTGAYTVEVSGAGVDMPSQGQSNGSTCVACEAAKKSAASGAQLAAHSGGVVSNGATATSK